MTTRLRMVALSLWTASALATTALAHGASGVGTARGPLTREPVRTVDAVDLNRYVGEWFEVARFPNRFQRQCVSDVRASYTQRADGRIDVINRCRTEDGSITEAHGAARVTDDRTFAKLKVRFAPAVLSFLPFVWGDYWILGLASDYSWATVGSPDRNYLWILARTPSPDAERLTSAFAAARANGFDVERLTKTIHTGAGPSDTR
jgi:apolipoprotein D and lipocalin family protein